MNLMCKTEFRKGEGEGGDNNISKSRSTDDIRNKSIDEDSIQSNEENKSNKRPSILAMMKKNNSLNSIEIGKINRDEDNSSIINIEENKKQFVTNLKEINEAYDDSNNIKLKSIDSNTQNSLNEQKSTSDTINIISNNNTLENTNKVLDESLVSKDNSFLNSTYNQTNP